MAEQRVTFCRICEASCGLIAEVQDGRVTSLAPDPEHPVTRGFACVKGIRYLDVHDSPDRVTTPLKRVGERFEPLGWEQALREIGDKVRDLRARHGAQSVGMYVGNPAAFSPAHLLFANAFVQGLGTRHLYTSGSQDCNNKFVVSQEMLGSPLLQPVPDLDRLECFILVGANPAVSQLSFLHAPRIMERLAAIERGGGHVAFVNPRRTESAKKLGQQVFIRPGTDVFFFLAFAHEWLATAAIDPRVAEAVRGLDGLREVVRPWTPERCAQVTGVEPAVLRQLVQRYRQADGAAMYCSTGVNQGPHGTLGAWLMQAINVLSGNLDRPGGLRVSRSMLRAAKLGYPTGSRIPRHHSRVGGFQSVLESFPAGVLPDEVFTPGEGQLRALFVTAGNPLLSCPNSARMEAALRDMELVVSIDLLRNETGDLAHYVLPTSSFLERDDMPMGAGAGYQPVPYAQYVDAVVPPRGECRDEWWIFSELARACGTPLRGSRLVQWFFDVSNRVRAWPQALRFRPRWLYTLMAWMSGVRLGTLQRRPRGVRLGQSQGRLFPGRVLTDSGKVELAPERFLRAAEGLVTDWERERAERAQLRLITKRERTSHNTWMHNVEAFVRGPRRTNYLYMHPEDAAARGLSDGGWCQVCTSTGAVQVPVKLSADLMPGVVALPHGWGHQRAQGLQVARRTGGGNANLLSADGPEALEPLSGMARLTALAVEVRPCLSRAKDRERVPSPASE